jgi:carbon monoxide dehydrogenase subunit G
MAASKADWSKRTAKKTAGTTVSLEDVVALPTTPDVVWARLEDVPLVASCLPGLDPATLESIGPNAFRAKMTNTVMGISAHWDLQATIRPDIDRRVLDVQLEGDDPRLNMKLAGLASVAVRADDTGRALLDYNANLRIDGSLAAMGGPVIRSILGDAIAQFVAVVGGREPVEQTSPLARLRARLRGWWARITKAKSSTNVGTKGIS